jgi:ORF6N domain
MSKKELQALVAEQKILNKIYAIRGEKVMLDRDLAVMYGVETRVLNQIIKRNLNRFPKDFMFQLSEKEFKSLISQNVTSSWGAQENYPMLLQSRALPCYRVY